MHKFGLAIAALLAANLAHAELYETRLADGSVAYSDRVVNLSQAQRHDRDVTHALQDGQLPGSWHARSPRGDAELTLRADGSFVFDQRSDDTPYRVYMCGSWAQAERALELEVKAHKVRLQSGETEQNAQAYNASARILAARRDRITLEIDGQRLTFDRRG